MIVRRLLMPLSLFALTALAGQAVAQGAFPAPLPNQSGAANQSSGASPFPPVNQSSGAAQKAAAPRRGIAVSCRERRRRSGRAAARCGIAVSIDGNRGGLAGRLQQGAAPLGGGLGAGAYRPQQGPAVLPSRKSAWRNSRRFGRTRNGVPS